MDPQTTASPDAPAAPPLKDKGTKRRQIIRIVLSWALAIIVVLLLQRYVFQSYQVFGHSMEPTLSEGDYLVISKLGVSWGHLLGKDSVPKRGEIIVLKSPLDGTRLIKRVIGLPGERMEVANGKVKVFNQEHINGFDPYQELGIPPRNTSGQISEVIPQGYIFVIGDNREAGGSFDSRSELGPIPLKDIIGHLVLRLYPLSKVHTY